MLKEINLSSENLNKKELLNSSLMPQFAIVVDDVVVGVLQVSEELALAFFSNPKFVFFRREKENTHVKHGVFYKNGEFKFPTNWKTVDGVPTPNTVITR